MASQLDPHRAGATTIAPDQTFGIEIKPPTGAVLLVERTASGAD
jgi:archaellin